MRIESERQEVTEDWRKLHKNLNFILNKISSRVGPCPIAFQLPLPPVHLVYISTLLLASCCSLFLHDIANWICIAVSCQLVLLSPLPKFLHYFCGEDVYSCSSEKFHCNGYHCLYFFLRVQNSLPYRRMRTASALYTFILEDFWTNQSWFKSDT